MGSYASRASRGTAEEDFTQDNNGSFASDYRNTARDARETGGGENQMGRAYRPPNIHARDKDNNVV